jgi:hypothetical protein
MAVPYRPNEHLRVTLRGQRLYLITDFQMVVSFDGRNDLGNQGRGTESGRNISRMEEGKQLRQIVGRGDLPGVQWGLLLDGGDPAKSGGSLQGTPSSHSDHPAKHVRGTGTRPVWEL